jgi:hypothetical protein
VQRRTQGAAMATARLVIRKIALLRCPVKHIRQERKERDDVRLP